MKAIPWRHILGHLRSEMIFSPQSSSWSQGFESCQMWPHARSIGSDTVNGSEWRFPYCGLRCISVCDLLCRTLDRKMCKPQPHDAVVLVHNLYRCSLIEMFRKSEMTVSPSRGNFYCIDIFICIFTIVHYCRHRTYPCIREHQMLWLLVMSLTQFSCITRSDAGNTLIDILPRKPTSLIALYYSYSPQYHIQLTLLCNIVSAKYESR